MSSQDDQLATEYGLVGVGPQAGVVVQSLFGLGFDNVLLVGNRDVEKIDIPSERRLVFDVENPGDMRAGEQWASANVATIFKKMEEKLGLPGRIFVVVAGDSSWAGASLVLVECAYYLLKKAGFTSSQRIGVFVATPPAVEVQSAQQAKDLKFLIDHLVESNITRRMIDPLIIGDRTNICSIFDSLAVTSQTQEPNDVIEENVDKPDVIVQKTQNVVKEFDDLYGE